MATFSRAVHSLPLLFAVSTCVTVIISYVLAVTSGQVYPVLPSISMTAAFEPQGSLFAQCLTVVSIIALLMISVRYLQLELLSRRLKERGQPCSWIKFNAIALFFGIACALALTMVASFRRPGTSEVRLLPMLKRNCKKNPANEDDDGEVTLGIQEQDGTNVRFISDIHERFLPFEISRCFAVAVLGGFQTPPSLSAREI